MTSKKMPHYFGFFIFKKVLMPPYQHLNYSFLYFNFFLLMNLFSYIDSSFFKEKYVFLQIFIHFIV